MPFVTIKTIEGLLAPTNKKEVHDKLTELMVEIEGDGNPEFAKFVVVNLSEEPAEHFSGGGVQLDPGMLQD